MFNPPHFGLYFTQESVKHIAKQKTRKPLDTAWNYLTTTNPLEPRLAMQMGGLRYRLNDDVAAGERAVSLLETMAPQSTDADRLYWDAIAETLLLAQCFELLRDHPAYVPGKQAQFLDALFTWGSEFNQEPIEMTLVEKLWLGALNMATGIVLEREPVFQIGVALFRQTVEEDIHPEGYIPKAVDIGPEEQALANQLLSIQALVLMAEMAAHVGVDLWAYAMRGVTVLTAVTYPLYYYFYAEKWPWNGDKWKPSDGVDLDTAQAIFKRHSGFLEIANRRYDKPLKAINLILDEIRPVYDPFGGGLTTLTHARLEKRGLFR